MTRPKPLSARQVADYCQVNFKTVLKWIDEGKLKAYKLPDSGVNRVSVDDLLDFLRRFNFPLPAELLSSRLPRLLIVDDEVSAVSMLRRLLRTSEFVIEEAHDGFEAGRKVESFRPDMMILDLNMPGMSGLEVLRQIKGNEKTSHVRVIVLSGFVDDQVRQDLKRAGVDGLLEKPIDRQALVALLGIKVDNKEA